MKELLKKLVNYLRYPSTWQGLIAVVVALGVTLSPEQVEAIVTAAVAAVGVVAVFLGLSDTNVEDKE